MGSFLKTDRRAFPHHPQKQEEQGDSPLHYPAWTYRENKASLRREPPTRQALNQPYP